MCKILQCLVGTREVKMARIDCNKVLPQELTIESIEDVLYYIGLSHHSVRDPPKRPKINNPKFITTFVFVVMIMKVVSQFTDDEITLVLLTEYSHYLGIKIYLNINTIFLSLIVLFTKANYFRNERRGVKPTFIRVFQVMSGSVPPSNVGLTDERIVKQLLRTVKLLPMIKKNNEIILPFLTALFLIIIYIFNMDTDRALLFGIYPTIVNTFWGYYTFNIIIIKLFLFFIVCKYFVLKIRAKNQILQTYKTVTPRNIVEVLHSYDALYREIDEYNSTYWSQFLFTIWLFFGVVIVNLLYLILFARISSFIRFLITYFVIILVIFYLNIMTTASSLNLEAYKSYNILHSFAAKYYKACKPGHRINVVSAIKVFKMKL